MWNENLRDDIRRREITRETKDLIKKIADVHDRLNTTLTEEQREMLNLFDDYYVELAKINEKTYSHMHSNCNIVKYSNQKY